MKYTLWPVILLVSLLAGCAGQPTSNTTNAVFTPSANLDLDSYEGFSEALAESMAAGDSSLFIDRLDTYKFARHSLSSLGLGAAGRSTTRKYAGTLQQIVNQRFGNIFTGVESARFLRSLPVEPAHPEATVALIRLTPEEGGISYWKVYLQQDNGRISVVDWLNYSLGDTASHAIGDFSLQVGTAINEPDTEDARAIKAYLAAVQSDDPNQLVSAYDQLPATLKTNALLMNSYQEAAGQISEKALKVARDKLAPAYRKKDSYALLLVDYYIETEQYEKAHHAVDKAVGLLGADAGMDHLHAGIALTAGDYKQSIAYARDGIEREAAYLGNYWTLLDALVFTKNYADAVMVLDIIEDGFGYEFDPKLLAEVEGYELFARSSQFKGWKSASSE